MARFQIIMINEKSEQRTVEIEADMAVSAAFIAGTQNTDMSGLLDCIRLS